MVRGYIAYREKYKRRTVCGAATGEASHRYYQEQPPHSLRSFPSMNFQRRITMPRRTFELSTSDETNIIDMKTGEKVKKPTLPIVCERIHYYRERLSMEKKMLGELVGVTGNAVGNWEAGRTRPDISLLPKICNALHITLYELFDVEDPTIQYTAREQLLMEHFQLLSDGHKHAVKSLVDTLLMVEESEKCRVVRQRILCDRSLAAGVGDPTEIYESGEPIFLYASSEVDKADYVFSVNGDSMEPEYHNGDLVLVQCGENGPNLAYGEIGAFTIGNETYIKVYEEDGLHSLNPAYKTMKFCDEEKVYLIGRVVGILDPGEIATQEDVEKYISLHPDEFEE